MEYSAWEGICVARLGLLQPSSFSYSGGKMPGSARVIPARHFSGWLQVRDVITFGLDLMKYQQMEAEYALPRLARAYTVVYDRRVLRGARVQFAAPINCFFFSLIMSDVTSKHHAMPFLIAAV